MKKISILFGVLILFSCKSLKTNITKENNKSSEVSIIALIANPQKYHKKRITVKGYFSMEIEGTSIYLSKNDFEKNLFKNGIYLYLGYDSLKEMNIEEPYKGYVKIEGTFNKNLKGSYDYYSGGLENITKIERLYKKGSLTDEYDTD